MQKPNIREDLMQENTFIKHTLHYLAVNEGSFHSLISLLDQLFPYEKQAIMLCDVQSKKMRVLREKER
ncbi:hypothetical protein [Lysinibacillus sp. NPDC096259]|uniref:hypothetical protein n=1 Tax=Lysinibacillus sp. NPDC096259 TaxID=3390583 RepID=UPI003CFBD203